MTDDDRLDQLSNDLNEVHALVEIARRMVWSAEGADETVDEPSARMRDILEHLDQAHATLDRVMDEVEAERDAARMDPGGPGHRPIIH
jgi:DNA repair ATPase RecN